MQEKENKKIEEATNEARRYLATPVHQRDAYEATGLLQQLYNVLTDEEDGIVVPDDDCTVWSR
ncbi:hypothetical protein ACOZ35_03375 [Halorubrum xinjiangense]|uniref:hypothetical protein n=1 Tax=Halorubrum xinjiangense TaxID=261291 RepID=UPI003C6EE907